MGEITGEIGKERILGGLLQTGQTTQYGGYEDDGYFEKGLSKQNTVLTTGDQAGTTSITVATKTDLISNNCVYDRRTKLMWSRYLSDGLGPADNGKMPWTTDGEGHGIYPFVAAANLAKFGGYGDWRVANRKELESLPDDETTENYPNSTAFPSWPNQWENIWTSTTFKSFTNYAFRTSRCGTNEFALKTGNNYVVLVRGG